MTGHESFEDLMRKRLNLLMEDARNVMVRGTVPDYEQYRELRGKILAYEQVIFEFGELVKQYREQNEL